MKKQRLLTILLIMLVLTGCTSSAKPGPITIDGRQDPPGKLIWNDEFNGSAATPPDPNIWTPNYGGNGWGNKQLEYDTNNKNAYQDGQGNLVIETDKTNPDSLKCWYGTCQYTSARISTTNHFSFAYGRLEARIKMPTGQGIWPAFWLLGSNCSTVGWPACGEMDIMENKGNEPALSRSSAHGPKDFTKDFSYTLLQTSFSDSFHTFALQWDPNYLYYFVDGIHYATLDKSSVANPQDWVFNHPFNIVLNTAVGGEWLGSPDTSTVFPQKMYVDYVRLYSI